jgi:hypothetical protein
MQSVDQKSWTGRYRDLKLYVVFTGESGLRIIGEIQVAC